MRVTPIQSHQKPDSPQRGLKFLAAGWLLLTLMLVAGCSSSSRDGATLPGTVGTNVNLLFQEKTGSILGIGDYIMVSFTDIPVGPATTTMTREQRIRIPDDGMITLPYNVRVQAAGRSTSQLEAEIRAKYVPDLFQSLTAMVTPEARFFYVGGEVKLPGKQAYVGNVTVLRGIETAGGFTDFAKRSKIEVRRSDGKVQYVNWKKARRNPRLDLDLFPNDYVVVPRGL